MKKNQLFNNNPAAG